MCWGILAAVALNFTVPVGAADAFNMEQFVTYKNEAKGFSIEYPVNWTQGEREGFDLFVQAPNNGASVSIISGEVAPEINTDLYYTLNLKNLLNDNSSIQIRDNCKTQMNGTPAYWVRYTRVDNNMADITQYLFVINKTGYVITTGSSATDYPIYKDMLGKIVKSFTKLEPKPNSP